MNHSMNTLDFYMSRQKADKAYKRYLLTAHTLTKKNGNEYFILLDDTGEFFIAGGFTAEQYPVLHSTYD